MLSKIQGETSLTCACNVHSCKTFIHQHFIITKYTIYRKIMNFVYIFNKQHRVGPLSPFCNWVLNLEIYLATFLNLKIYLVTFLNHKSTFLSRIYHHICIETDAPVTSRIPLISGSLNLYKFMNLQWFLWGIIVNWVNDNWCIFFLI